MKKRLWAAKAIALTSIWLRKMENDIFKLNCMVLKKSKANSQYWNIKISITDLKKRCIVQKGSNVMICAEAKWKASKICNHFLWEVIYVHFYNWDRPLDLVPVVYDLIELIIEASLWFNDYSTFNTHPRHTRLCSNNAYFICVIVHVQMWCVCSSAC